ncbi:thiamine phosphate synthase [Asticcacaulis sp. ZE23SCel15]|uniref:thiamine phosphate synthase n=1 Tax=Asticcacaulis sp. ZE23SCel15 TaxID=3059027 RepID=UPI00265F0528|nr:thiamine phosphate synthase [Asticcacaulis sp. ZE23SCel15]WKL58284.1 thiamine phosphate synthase [Asticcacaulis sp. ZE23SCel15]
MTYKTRFAYMMNKAKDIARSAHMSSPLIHLNGHAPKGQGHEPASDLPPLFFFTDPERTPHPEDVASLLPTDCGIIYRSFGDKHAPAHARVLKSIAQQRGLKLFIGNDVDLALEVGADGVHLPERNLEAATDIRRLHPQLYITAACHSLKTLDNDGINALDAVFISPVFASNSPSAHGIEPLGAKGVKAFCELSPVPVYGLGGIGVDTVDALMGTGLRGLGAVDAFMMEDEMRV